MTGLDALVTIPTGRVDMGSPGLDALLRRHQDAPVSPTSPGPDGAVQGASPVRGPGLDSDPAAVRKAATLLESHFLTMLLQEMRTPLLDREDDEGYFTPGREERLFTRHLDIALGDLLAERSELGLAELIVRQLLPEAASQVSDPSADT